MQIEHYPYRYPSSAQIYRPTPANPYPMNFMQAPSYGHQVLVNYRGQPTLQGLSTIRGPFMFPVRTEFIYPLESKLPYPMSHSIPDPFQRTYIGLAGYYTRKGPYGLL
jgi:hypothetical protein